MTMRETAARTGVSVQRICDWEAWARIPDRENGRSLWNSETPVAMAYARTLGLTLDGLMGMVPADPRLGDATPDPVTEPSDAGASEDAGGLSLAGFMDRAGMDTLALSRASGVSRQNVARWMRWHGEGSAASAVDPSRMRVLSLCRVASALGVSMEVLASGLAAAF